MSNTHTIKIEEKRIVDHEIELPYYTKDKNKWFYKLDENADGTILAFKIAFYSPIPECGWTSEANVLHKDNTQCTKEDWDAAKERFIKYMETI